MGVEPPEARSLPRNRKCGNCRFYEPAPLWRKGWCRNPRLYPPHANHLVDATTIDCEGGFRSRIYWEPVPEAPAPPIINRPEPQPTQPFQFQPRSNEQTTVGFRAQPVGKPINHPPEPTVEADFDVIETTALAHPLPAGIGPGKDWRLFLRQRLPFTEKWPLEKVELNQRNIGIAASATLIVLILLILLISNLGKKSDAEPTSQVMLPPFQTASAQLTIRSQPTATPRNTPNSALSPAPGSKAGEKTALVKGNGPTPLNMREEASLKGKLITGIKEGEKVTILDGPKEADGRNWYKIQYNGQIGWAAKDYLELQS